MILARRVVEDIRRRDFHAGDRLPSERVMLEDYRVGRGTLREALRFLELQKVISLKPGPGGGPTVEKPDASTLATTMLLLLQFDRAPLSAVIETRSDLEPLMARLAAERMTADELRALAGNVDRMREGLNDHLVFHRADQEFHDLVAWGTHNSVYAFLVEALLDILDGSALDAGSLKRRREVVLHAHASILEALHAHDGDASHAAMEGHMEEYVRYVSQKHSDVLAREVTWNRS